MQRTLYNLPMSITARGNIYDNTTGAKDNGAGGTGGTITAFTKPPYAYTMNKTADVPDVVPRCTGPQ